MHRFESLERAGLSVAAMTSKTNPDPILPGGANPRTVKQVHGARIVDVETLGDNRPEADGMTVATPGLAIAVNIADCVPVLLYDPNAKAAAAIHAGRRGLEAGIVTRAVQALEKRGANPGHIHAAIGPSAGPCCYEVSMEMAEAWISQGLPAQGRMLDLWAAAKTQLSQAGVPEKQIDLTTTCTICTDRFYSYRSGDLNPRNLAYLMI